MSKWLLLTAVLLWSCGGGIAPRQLLEEDAGTDDGGGTCCEVVDAGTDAGELDGGNGDAGEQDGGEHDAGADAGVSDAGLPSVALCEPCVADEQCPPSGANGTRSHCLSIPDGPALCGSFCTTNADCSPGSECLALPEKRYANCYPYESLTCDGSAPDAGVRSLCTEDTWENFAKPIITSCKNCHTHSHDFRTLSDIRSARKQAYELLQMGSMFGSLPSDQLLVDADRERLVRWIECGMPQ